MNWGNKLAIGQLVSDKGVEVRSALPLGSTSGGIIEYVVPNPRTQVVVTRVLDF